MRFPIWAGKIAMGLLVLSSLSGMGFAAAPTITNPANVDIFYDTQNPGDLQFAYRVVATNGPTTFEAVGLPPDAAINPSTGWINGSRNVPGNYAVTVRAANAEGTATTTLHLAIHPAAVGVTSTQGVFRAGQRFGVTVHYNTAVMVAGAPKLTLAIGPAGAVNFKDAIYASGSGTNELVFEYAVASGDEDSDGVQLLPSAPNGGTVCDANGLSASPTLPVRYFTSGIVIAADQGSGPGSGGSTEPATAGANGRLVNVSARMRVVEGDANRTLITGFVISGTGAKRVLLRAVGPALGAFGVQGLLGDPRLRVYASNGELVTENDNWSTAETSAAASAVGAFPLAAGTRDAAAVIALMPGAYTLVVAPNGGAGVTLAEVYDADVDPAPSPVEIGNLSVRGYVDASDGGALIAGFVVKGETARQVLIRGAGPALTTFGVAGALGDPTLKIYQGEQLVATNDDWQTSAAAEITAAGSATGAFAFPAGSKDAAVVLTLAPGAYTAVVSAAGNTSGASLVEVYELPVSNP